MDAMSTSYSIPYDTDHTAPVVLDRREGPSGEVVLRRHGALLQIIANGCFLMDTSDGRSERLLVDAALEALDDRPAPGILIGGLGVGFSLTHAAANSRWGRIAVVEREPAIVDWHRAGPLSELSRSALADPRTEIVEADLVSYVQESTETYDALCLDIDNGPDWTGRTRGLPGAARSWRRARRVVRTALRKFRRNLAECRIPVGPHRRDPGCPGRSGRRTSRGQACVADSR
jgi:hypothetical protein